MQYFDHEVLIYTEKENRLQGVQPKGAFKLISTKMGVGMSLSITEG